MLILIFCLYRQAFYSYSELNRKERIIVWWKEEKLNRHNSKIQNELINKKPSQFNFSETHCDEIYLSVTLLIFGDGIIICSTILKAVSFKIL